MATVQTLLCPPQVVQGLVVGRLSSRFSEAALLRASVLVFIAVGLAMVRAPPPHPEPPSRGLRGGPCCRRSSRRPPVTVAPALSRPRR